MGGIGRQNPLPFQLGGGQTELERIWFEMRKHLGDDGAGPIGGIEDRWRFARACGLSMVTRMGRKALMQFFPRWATDSLSVWEDLLRVQRASTEEGRRIAVAEAYTLEVSAIVPNLREALQRIDSSIDVVAQDETHAIHFKPGKYLRPRDSGAADYGDQAGSYFPTFCSHFIVTVLWPAGPSFPSDERLQVEQHLNDSLPSWYDWRIINGSGFYLDGYNDSRLDLTAFD